MSEYKVLHIHNSYRPKKTGGALRIANILENVVRLNPSAVIDVLIVDSHSSNRMTAEEINGITVFRVPSYWHISYAVSKLIKTRGYDIIHSHNPRTLFFSYLFCGHTKHINELHSLQPLSKAKEWLAWFILNRLDKIIVLSNAASEYVKTQKNISADRIYVLKNGFTDKLRNISSANKATKGPVTNFVYAGSLHEWQGVRILCQAFDDAIQKGINAKLTIIGDGPDSAWIKNYIDNNILNEVLILLPSMEQSTLWSVLRDFDYFCMPRPKLRSTELTVPIKPYEIGLLGIPLVLSDLPGLREALSPNCDDNGVFVEPGNIENLSNLLIELTKDEVKDVALKRAENYRRTITASVQSWESVAIQLDQLYKNIKRTG